MDLDRLGRTARTGEVGKLGKSLRGVLRTILGFGLRLLHRPTLAGYEHLPERGAFLIVANHSGGGVAEVGCLALLWHERFQDERPMTGMAHPLAFHLFPFAPLVRALGAIPATYEAAERALASGVPVIVFPGGDHEAFRPIWQANRVDFAGRKGFLKLARRAGVPIVPLGIRGSHYTTPILWRSRALAWLTPWRLLGVKRIPITLLGLAGGAGAATVLAPHVGLGLALLAGYALLVSPLAMLPWFPLVPIRARFGPAIAAAELLPEEDPAALESAYERVRGSVESLVRSS